MWNELIIEHKRGILMSKLLSNRVSYKEVNYLSTRANVEAYHKTTYMNKAGGLLTQ
jgi:hypothetical protein